MTNQPTLVLVHGSWHRGVCYDPIVKLLQGEHGLKCIAVDLPSTSNNPEASFKDDIDVTQDAIRSETTAGRDVIVIAHSYGGMVGSSAIKGFAKPKTEATESDIGHVIGFILIASGCNMAGLAFMDPFFGIPPPSWRVNKETGYAELTVSPRDLFYHDVPEEEAEYWVSKLTSQSLKALFEGGEYSYPGWQDVPVWYIGTTEDHGLPVVAQRMGIGLARQMGAVIEHREMRTSHSPFLSQPKETVEIIVQAVEAFTGRPVEAKPAGKEPPKGVTVPAVRILQPLSWFRFGLPMAFGRMMGAGFLFVGWWKRAFGRSK